jgi:hypothetical protein
MRLDSCPRKACAGALTASDPRMPSMLVTCPESAHLEHLEYVEHPLGMLITRCTGSPELDCPRTCAARLDRRKHQRRLADGTILFATSCLRRS